MKTDELIAQLKTRTEALVKRGGDLRAETARLVEETSSKVYQAKDGLSDLVKAVAEGAVAGARETVPENTESALKHVVEGVTDGLTKSATAVRLTLEEAAASGSHFAQEDLRKVAEDFRTVTNIMADIITTAASATGSHLKAQAQAFGEHAQTALQNVRPALESAVNAALEHPARLGSETLHAGSTAARQAAGVLFTELGACFDKVGSKLRH